MSPNCITNKIIPLSKEKWQYHCLEFNYISREYYDVEINHTDNNFQVSFIRKSFETPYEKLPDDSDKLFQPWWEDAKAWGIIDNDKLIAVIETSLEGWSNRLRVTELWIDNAYRRMGIGRALMNIAMNRAKEEKRRALILETQSCNVGAIDFYLAYGFTLIGFDGCCYQNDDITRKEVRMEFGIFISG